MAPGASPGYGGVENMLMYLIGRLRDRGHRVILGTVGQSDIKVDQQSPSSGRASTPRSAPSPPPSGWPTSTCTDAVGDPGHRGIDVVHDFLEIVGPSLLAELGPGYAPPVLHTLQWNLRLHQEFYQDFDGQGRVWFNGISKPQMEAAVGNLRATQLDVVHNGVDVRTSPSARTRTTTSSPGPLRP